MFEKLEDLERRYETLSHLLGQPEVISKQEEFQKAAKEYAELGKVVELYRRVKKVREEIRESQDLVNDEEDEEIRRLAKEEVQRLTEAKEKMEEDLRLALLPKDPNDEKNILLEIRAGTGGDEAGLFASDLFRMYSKYAEKMGWRLEILSRHFTGVGGFKELIALIEGKRVYSRLKFESGVHRVQRVPTTESQGRIHTSTVTVAILPEAEDVDVQIDPNDLRIDIFRSSGPGGQSVNTTDSAVRITHLPTGMVVSCQDEKSQHKNKAKGLKILRARLLDKAKQEKQTEISEKRRLQVGTGERSERIRTYNFSQGRVTDHRIGLTLYRLDGVLEGDLDEILQALTTHYQTETLKGEMENSRVQRASAK
ncbi:MAG: peptide chain release factor 1 [Deltaproteobacteria bacterium RBG_16_50_11]|nr:MAG: peptide chain release factor 1 [Deltaproteobacteria bacterium RBG_16_50_11]